MSEVAVERGEIGLERLRIAFPERGGKGWSRDSAFAELLQTRAGDVSQADHPSIAADRAAPSTPAEAPSRADNSYEDSRRDEEERQDDVEGKDSSQVTPEAVAVEAEPNVGAERLPEQGDESVLAASDSETLEEGERRRGGQTNDSPGATLSAVKNALQPGSRSRNQPAAEVSSTRQGAEEATIGKDVEQSLRETTSQKAADATEITTMGHPSTPVNLGDIAASRDRKNFKGEEADPAQPNRKAPRVRGERPKPPIAESPGAGEGVQAGKAGEADRNLVSALATKDTESNTTDDVLAVDRGRSRSKRYGQKGEVNADESIQRFQPTRGSQDAPRAVTEGPAALPNPTPAPGENVSAPVGVTAASATAAAASDSNAAINAPSAVAGAGNTRTDSEATATEARATDSGRTADGAPSNLDAADRARFVQRVSQAFRAANERGGHVRLRLHPPELGSLRVELKITDGVMSARIEAESAAARDLLAEHLPVLRQRLADHGIRVERFELDLMGQNGQGPSQQAFQPPADGQGRRHQDMTPARRRMQAAESPGGPEGNAVGIRTASGIDVII